MKKGLFVGILFAVFVSVLTFGVALAQDSSEDGGSGFRVSPTRYDLTIDRGNEETSIVTIQNITSVTQTARIIVDDFGPTGDESGTPKLLLGDDAVDDYPYSIKPFVQPVQDIQLAPGQEADIPVTMSIPDSTSPGSYYGLIRFIGTDSPDFEDVGQGAVALSASVGTVFLVQVPGDTIDLLELEQMGAASDGNISTFFSSAPTTNVVRIANKGNTFQAPFGKVLVKDWSGNVVYEYELNNKTPRGNVLPDSIRRFEDPIENIGSFGRYTIEANISYGDGSNLITATASFWVIPWLTILAIAAAIVILAFLATRGIKTYNQRIVSKSKKF